MNYIEKDPSLKSASQEVILSQINLPVVLLASLSALGVFGTVGCSDQTITSLPTNEAPAFLQDARNSFNQGRSIEDVLAQYDSAQEFVARKFGQKSMQNALLEIEIGNILGQYGEHNQAIERLVRADNLLQGLSTEMYNELPELRLRTLGALSEQYENNDQLDEAARIKARAIGLREELYR